METQVDSTDIASDESAVNLQAVTVLTPEHKELIRETM